MNYDNWKLETPPDNKESLVCDICLTESCELYDLSKDEPLQVCSECLNKFHQPK